MEFYQKLQKLRKENGMSQEELAGLLDVSRQAVNKWESGLSYPETNTIIQISGIFNVSLDYLLKNADDIPLEVQVSEKINHEFLYLNKEDANEYIEAKRLGSIKIALGVSIMILGIMWPAFFSDSDLGSLIMFIQAAIGVGILVFSMFSPKHYNEEIENYPLNIDAAYLNEFKQNLPNLKRKSGIKLVAGVCIIIIGIAASFAMDEILNLPDKYVAPVFISFVAIGVALIIIAGSAIITYNIIAKNKEHIENLKYEKQKGSIMGAVMIVATAVFLLVFFMEPTSYSHSRAWVVFPVFALLGTALTQVINNRRKKDS